MRKTISLVLVPVEPLTRRGQTVWWIITVRNELDILVWPLDREFLRLTFFISTNSLFCNQRSPECRGYKDLPVQSEVRIA